MEAEQLLQRVPLFQSLDQKQLTVLAKSTHERSFDPNEVIVRQGEGGIGLYVIGSGRVEVLQLRDGSEKRLRTMGPGESFGELGLLTDHPRTATVRAIEQTTCLVLTAWNFRSMLDESPDMARHLARTLAQWLVEAEDRQAGS